MLSFLHKKSENKKLLFQSKKVEGKFELPSFEELYIKPAIFILIHNAKKI